MGAARQLSSHRRLLSLTCNLLHVFHQTWLSRHACQPSPAVALRLLLQGQFAALDGKQPKSWVEENNIASFFESPNSHNRQVCAACMPFDCWLADAPGRVLPASLLAPLSPTCLLRCPSACPPACPLALLPANLTGSCPPACLPAFHCSPANLCNYTM